MSILTVGYASSLNYTINLLSNIILTIISLISYIIYKYKLVISILFSRQRVKLQVYLIQFILQLNSHIDID